MKKLTLLKKKDVEELINTRTVLAEAERMFPDYNLETQLNEYIKVLVKICDSARCYQNKTIASMKYFIAITFKSYFDFEDIRQN